ADYLLFRDPDGYSVRMFQYKTFPAPASVGQLHDWRQITVDVSPAGVDVYWGPDFAPAFHLPTTRLQDRVTAFNTVFAKDRPGTVLAAREWNPRRPLGVYARDSAAAFRNVTLQPLPVRSNP